MLNSAAECADRAQIGIPRGIITYHHLHNF
jgi:hypothetical protein